MSKYKVGDKVVLRNDLVFGKKYGRFEWGRKKDEYLGDLDYVEILNVFSESAYEVTTGWCITDEMIEGLYEEPIEDETKYLWASDEYEASGFKYIKFMIKGNNARSYDVDSMLHKEILKGKHDKFLMTESEAKEHHLFKAMNRMEVEKEELYFIRPFDCEQQHLIELGGGYLFVGDKDHYVNSEARKHFTKEECDEIIGTSTILHKVLVE